MSFGRLVLAGLLATCAASAAANVLVVRAAGPSAGSYPPGRSLPDDARIALRSGDTLVVLDARGTRTFRGPGTFSPSQAAQAGARTTLASSGRRVRVGAVRSAGIVPASPTTIWHIDASMSGNMCLADTNNVRLWRGDTSQATRVTISGPGGTSREVAWPAGAATLAWPSDLPITDGAQYQLALNGVAVPSRVTFRTLESPPADMTAVAAALIERECQEQLDLLVDSAPVQ
ncbi:hypothetical protein [Sphingosinicella sp. CPCC 101087]|uniref:hypothetical protein n=1 Tax=Sphingosinicella sp. CPCC 101087 TaxID=2497754 RepID=UPI00101BD4FB|nr:hypothetical protein [Sphingosinicella sp. CPCC 101087]